MLFVPFGVSLLLLGRVSDSDTIRSLLLENSSITVRAVKGPRPAGLAPLLGIYDVSQREIFLVGVSGDDLILRRRLRAADWRLDVPDRRIAGPMEGVAIGDTVFLWLKADDGRFCWSLNNTRACTRSWTVGRGWALLKRVTRLPNLARLCLDGPWIAFLVVPFGLWAQPNPLRYLGAAALGLALLVTGKFADVENASVFDWTGLAAGRGFGITLQHLVRRSQQATRHAAQPDT